MYTHTRTECDALLGAGTDLWIPPAFLLVLLLLLLLTEEINPWRGGSRIEIRAQTITTTQQHDRLGRLLFYLL